MYGNTEPVSGALPLLLLHINKNKDRSPIFELSGQSLRCERRQPTALLDPVSHTPQSMHRQSFPLYTPMCQKKMSEKNQDTITNHTFSSLQISSIRVKSASRSLIISSGSTLADIAVKPTMSGEVGNQSLVRSIHKQKQNCKSKSTSDCLSPEKKQVTFSCFCDSCDRGTPI